jgi:flagellar biosynthesis/type III secretory pathway protein FliH
MKLLNPLEQMFVDDGIKKGLKQGRQEGLIHGLKKGREEGREEGREQGREEGREQGREEGRAEGAVALLERQLIQRFGPLPKTAQVKLAKASVAQVEAWSDALVVAESLKQVFGATR